MSQENTVTSGPGLKFAPFEKPLPDATDTATFFLSKPSAKL